MSPLVSSSFHPVESSEALNVILLPRGVRTIQDIPQMEPEKTLDMSTFKEFHPEIQTPFCIMKETLQNYDQSMMNTCHQRQSKFIASLGHLHLIHSLPGWKLRLLGEVENVWKWLENVWRCCLVCDIRGSNSKWSLDICYVSFQPRKLQKREATNSRLQGFWSQEEAEKLEACSTKHQESKWTTTSKPFLFAVEKRSDIQKWR